MIINLLLSNLLSVFLTAYYYLTDGLLPSVIMQSKKKRQEDSMKGEYYTFVIRIRCESEGKFRGYIQNIRSQEEAHFETYTDMQYFISSYLSPSNDRATSKDRPVG
jgi:hypothetical protein